MRALFPTFEAPFADKGAGCGGIPSHQTPVLGLDAPLARPLSRGDGDIPTVVHGVLLAMVSRTTRQNMVSTVRPHLRLGVDLGPMQ